VIDEAAMTRNLFLSLLLSIVLTLTGTVLYVFYPILRLVLGTFFSRAFSSDAHSDGIAVVAGGVSETVFPIALFIAAALFLVIFTLLQRRSRKQTRG